MIKQGLTNYFKNLKYFFTPLGTLALGFVFGLSVFLPGVSSSLQAMVDEVQTVLADASIDFVALKNSLTTAVRALDWQSPLSAIGKMLSAEWLTETLNGCVNALVESSEVYTVPINEAVTAFLDSLSFYFSALIAFTFFGVLGGYFLTKWLIRRHMAKRALWKYFLASFIDSILTATLVALCAWLLTVWKPSIFISSSVSLVLFGFIALLEAYIVHARGNTDVKQIVNAKNIFLLFATDLIIFLIAALIIVIIIAITNSLVGIFIGIALTEIAFIVISLNAEAYVKSFIPEAELTA